MQSTLEDTAWRLTVLAGLLSQDHARILAGPASGSADYIEPIYLAELLVSNTGLATAVLAWADAAGIVINHKAPLIKPDALEFDRGLLLQAKLAKKPGDQARGKLLDLVPNAVEVLADISNAHANTSDSDLGGVGTAKAKVGRKI